MNNLQPLFFGTNAIPLSEAVPSQGFSQMAISWGNWLEILGMYPCRYLNLLLAQSLVDSRDLIIIHRELERRDPDYYIPKLFVSGWFSLLELTKRNSNYFLFAKAVNNFICESFWIEIEDYSVYSNCLYLCDCYYKAKHNRSHDAAEDELFQLASTLDLFGSNLRSEMSRHQIKATLKVVKWLDQSIEEVSYG